MGHLILKCKNMSVPTKSPPSQHLKWEKNWQALSIKSACQDRQWPEIGAIAMAAITTLQEKPTGLALCNDLKTRVTKTIGVCQGVCQGECQRVSWPIWFPCVGSPKWTLIWSSRASIKSTPGQVACYALEEAVVCCAQEQAVAAPSLTAALNSISIRNNWRKSWPMDSWETAHKCSNQLHATNSHRWQLTVPLNM